MKAVTVGVAFWLIAGQIRAHEPAGVTIENDVLTVRVSPTGAELMSLIAKESKIVPKLSRTRIIWFD